MAIFFIVSLITYRYFNMDERGMLSIYWATFFIFELFILDLGTTIMSKVPTHIKKKEKQNIENIIFSTYLVRSLSGVILGAFLFGFSDQISSLIMPENADHIGMIFVLKSAAVFFLLNTFLGPVDHSVLIAFQKYEMMRTFYNIKIVPMFISAITTLLIKESPEFMFFTYLILRLVMQSSMGWYAYYYLNKNNNFSLLQIKFNLSSITLVCKHGLPIWFGALISVSTPHLAIFILGQNSGLNSVAQFSLAMSLFMAAIAFLQMLDGWLVPKLSEQKDSSMDDIYSYTNRYYKLYFYLSLVFAILIILFAEFGVKVISGSGYEESALLLIVLCCFLSFRTLTIFRNIIVVFGSTNIITIFIFFKFLLEITLMLLTVPKFGAYGILISQFVSIVFIGQLYIYKTLSSFFIIQKISKLFFNKYVYMCSLSSVLTSMLLYLFVSGYSLLFYSLSILFLILCIILIFTNKEDFKKILAI